MLWEAFFATK